MLLIRTCMQLIHLFSFSPSLISRTSLPAYSKAKLKSSEYEVLCELGSGHVYHTNDTNFVC